MFVSDRLHSVTTETGLITKACGAIPGVFAIVWIFATAAINFASS